MVDALRPGPDEDNPYDTFWPDIDLDLTGATLINLNLTGCHLRAARFGGASFTEDVWFGGTSFTGHALFDRASFTEEISFKDATLVSMACMPGAIARG